MNKKFTQPHLDDKYTHIDHKTANPFARIECRVRRALPTLCDGTCRNCTQERTIFLETEVKRRLSSFFNNPEYGSSPDLIDPPKESEVRIILEDEIAKMKEQKARIVGERLVLSMKVIERIRILGQQATSPDAPTSIN